MASAGGSEARGVGPDQKAGSGTAQPMGGRDAPRQPMRGRGGRWRGREGVSGAGPD